MVNKIRRFRSWLAIMMLIAFFPCVAASVQPLVWCFGADGHSGIEVANDQHSDCRRAKKTAGVAQIASTSECFDFELASVGAVLSSQPSSSDLDAIRKAVWVTAATLSSYCLHDIAEPRTMMRLRVAQSHLPHTLDHFRTVVLRV